MLKKRPSIIAVDDNDSNTTLLKYILSGTYNITTYNNPKKVLEHVKNNKPHLILSDLVMPEMDGIDLMRNIKNNMPELPFIILSAYDDEEDIKKAYENGAYKYMVKPINIPNLIENIENALKQL